MKLCYYELDYDAGKAKFIVGDGDRFTVTAEPKITIPRFATLIDGNRKYELDATFDFSKIPARYRAFVLQAVGAYGACALDLPRNVR